MALETVSFQRRNLEGTTPTTYTDVIALLTRVGGDLMGYGDGSQSTVEMRNIHIQASTLSVIPRRGDRVVSDTSGVWEVLTCNKETLGTRYACYCKKISD